MQRTDGKAGGFIGTALGALALVALLTAPAGARPLRVKQDLTPTGLDPNAQGRAQLVLKTASDGKFDVVVKKLDRDATFEVLVNGVKVGTLVTKGGGSGKASFRSRPRGHDQLLGFDPRGATVTLRNADGQDVLDGTVPDDSVDPTEVVCCLPDGGGDGETECEDRTADACTQAGGTVSTATSCLPDPCGGVAPPIEVICCIAGSAAGAFSGGHDDGGEVECEDRSAAECAAAGGTVVPATSCTPDPCAPTPPPADEIVCCVPHHGHSTTECEVLTPDTCTAREGTPSTATSCTPDACAGSPAAGTRGRDDGPGHDAVDDHHGRGGKDDPAGHR